eukprot:TRINITY_DN3284_c0_g1_i1.p2 TRINITY_DN3284_c0_g1~~TRINITY_DN3284_c0_g1_i1.p2  ORF type:complete len:151 (+),score=42.94 TRINITY_DN3284_c0_g1_i1:307-759(+)
MLPPVYARPAVAAVRGIGSEGWSAYRRVLRKIHSTFDNDLAMLTKMRNEARKAWWVRRNVSGEDLKKCVAESATLVDELGLVVAAYEDPTGADGVRVNINKEQMATEHLALEFVTPAAMEEKNKDALEQQQRELQGLRAKRSYKATVKCV